MSRTSSINLATAPTPRLGSGRNAAAIAARNGIPEARLRQLLRSDETLWLDKKGHRFYVETPPAPVESIEPPIEGGPIPYEQTFQLHSKSGSNRVIFLDFDGTIINGTAWNANFGVPANFAASGFDLDGDPASFSNAEMDIVQSVWQRVSEDYAPFDIDVTTQDPGLAALDRTDANDSAYGVHAVITKSAALWASTCNSSCGGIAYVGVSNYVAPSHEYYQPALMFQNSLGGNPKYIGEATSHEVGHNFGLSHDGTPSSGYYYGQGSWAPVMGVGYSRPIVQFSKGEYTRANNQEDDFAVIATHGGVLRADDYGDTIGSATSLPANGTALNGIISSASDVDFFSITSTGSVTVTATPAGLSPNLDIRLDLYGSTGTPLSSNDPPAATVTTDAASGLGASLTINSTGTFYVRVDGVGFGTAAATGYSDYASVGQYSISATTSNAPRDFNGDGKSDLLWRNSTTGEVVEWFMNGGVIGSQASQGAVPASWVIAGTGDFNGDGKSDLLWRNSTTGEVVEWFMNGGVIGSQASQGAVPASWVIAGTGDFNGDGKSDLLWRNSTTGEVVEWFMNGGVIGSQASQGAVPASWVIAGTGDFNGDGKSDLLWRNSTTGEVVEWFMNGGAIGSQASQGAVPASWVIAGTGDFNGDGKSDLLWRNSTTGEVVEWFMNGGAIGSQASQGAVPASWVIAGTGDFNGDGKSDLLWRNSTTGEVVEWFMNGGAIGSQASQGAVPASWIITP